MDNQRLKGQGTFYLRKKKRKKQTESSRQTLFTPTPLHYSDKIMTQSNLLHFDHPTAIKKNHILLVSTMQDRGRIWYS